MFCSLVLIKSFRFIQESLFMQDSNEGGVDVDNNTEADDETTDDNDEEDEEENTSSEDDDETDENNIDRVAQFYQAFESAKEADTFGYISQSTTHADNLSKQTTDSNKGTIRNSKDLAAISWASFCTGEKNNLQRDVIKIQALDTTNVLQRLQLAAAMLREEKKKWKAKLALAGITDSGKTDERPLG
jgi:hypothetical protein